MKNVVYITAMREGYAIDQIHRTMTVRELIRLRVREEVARLSTGAPEEEKA